VQTAPPSEILNYLGRTADNYNSTDASGTARIPYFWEIMNESSMPKTWTPDNYDLNISYVNATGVTYYAEAGLSFSPYPMLSEPAMNKNMTVKLADLFLDKPDLLVSAIDVTPSPLYLDDTATIAATIQNTGLTGATDVKVDFFDGSTPIGNTTIPVFLPTSQMIISMTWLATPVGVHAITVKVDMMNTILESNKANNERSVQVNVLANLPDLTIVSGGISFDPQPALTGEDVTATVVVSNAAGRADATGVVVEFYIGDPATGGLLLGSSTIDVSAGTTNSTSFTWVPSQIGTYSIFVSVNPDHLIPEYSYANNIASREVTVTLSENSNDLIVENNDVMILEGAAFTITGKVIVRDNGTLIIRNGSLSILQAVDDQYQVFVLDNGAIQLSSAVLSSNLEMPVYLYDSAMLTIDASTIDAMLTIHMDDNSQANVDDSSVGADIIAPPSSSAVLTAEDAQFATAWSSFGGDARAYLTSISIPAIDVTGNAVAYDYRTVSITVLDGTGSPLPNSVVNLTYYVNGTQFASMITNEFGQVEVHALCDVITADEILFVGNYLIEGTYIIEGQAFVSDQVPLSLQPYSEPLVLSDVSIDVSIPSAPLVTGPYDLIVDNNDHVTLTGTVFTIRGKVLVEDDGILTIESGGLFIQQNTADQFQIVVQDNGKIVLDGASLDSNWPIWMHLSGNAVVDANNSMLYDRIRFDLRGDGQVKIVDSLVGSDFFAPTGSAAVLTAMNTTFTRSWGGFGGDAIAYLTSVNIPAVVLHENAVALMYSWIRATVLDGTGAPLANAHAELRYYFNGTLFAAMDTDANGQALFQALGDRLTAGSVASFGNYRENATFWFDGERFDTASSDMVAVSLVPYASPLVRHDFQTTMMIRAALPDLDPPLTASNHTPYRGDNVTLSAQITNIGVVDANNVLVRFKDASSAGNLTLTDIIVPKIVPGQMVTVSWVWAASYPLGSHTLMVIVDPNNAIPEMDKSNNFNKTLVTVMGVAELYVTASDVTVTPSAPTTNSSVSIVLLVHNSGDVAATNVNISFTDVRPGGSRAVIGYFNIPTIAPTGTGIANIDWMPRVPFQHALEIKVNVGIPAIPEHDLGNNNISIPITVRNYADLIPTGVTTRPVSPLYVETNVFLDASINNAGETAANSIVVRFWLGAVTTGTLLGETTVSSVGVGESATASIAWHIAAQVGGKIQTRQITVDVNPLHVVQEISYTNNQYVKQLTVVDNRPDLKFADGVTIISGGEIVNTSVIGETLDLRVNVTNDGYTPAMNARILFQVADSDSFTTYLGVVSSDFAANETKRIDLAWVVNVTMPGNYVIWVTLDPLSMINETIEDNNQASVPLTVNAPSPLISIGMNGVTNYKPGDTMMVSVSATNQKTGGPLGKCNVTVLLTDASHTGVSASVVDNLDDQGHFTTPMYLRADLGAGTYLVAVQVQVGNRTYQQNQEFTVQVTSDLGLPLWIYLLVIIVVLAVIIIASILLYKYSLGKMVECGECGALIPENSKKCPKCGTEFETGTAKCSECGAWIPAASKECPECGAKFLNAPLPEEEDEYIRKMRQQYESYADTYREQARSVLGKKYNEARFADWWKKQPSYLTFEKWLAQEEEKRKAAGGAFPCPSCGTLNPKGSEVCHKCGTVFDKKEDGPLVGADAGKDEQKPLRRIVRRPAEKKLIPKKEGSEGPQEPKPEQGPEGPEGPKSP
jgi:subtilase family serine protease/ribosomal protein L40E